jgi:hypothetical protein
LLFFALTFPFWGNFVALQLQKKKVKHDIKWSIAEGLPKSELTHLTFGCESMDSQVVWKHSKEFEFEGEMYDIVYKDQVGDSLHYWCWWDKEETMLNRKIEQLAYLALSGQETTSNQQTHFFRFVKLMNLPPDETEVNENFSAQLNRMQDKEFKTLSKEYSPAVPPPIGKWISSLS